MNGTGRHTAAEKLVPTMLPDRVGKHSTSVDVPAFARLAACNLMIPQSENAL